MEIKEIKNIILKEMKKNPLEYLSMKKIYRIEQFKFISYMGVDYAMLELYRENIIEEKNSLYRLSSYQRNKIKPKVEEKNIKSNRGAKPNLCLNCGHNKGSHKQWVRDGSMYETCKECGCMDFLGVREYPKHRKILLEKKIWTSIETGKYDKKYHELTGTNIDDYKLNSHKN